MSAGDAGEVRRPLPDLGDHPGAPVRGGVQPEEDGRGWRLPLGTRPVAAVAFLVLMGGALGPVFMTAQNAMLRCAPGRTDLALAANSGGYDAGIAAGAALGALLLPHVGTRGVFLAGGLLTAGACAVLRGGQSPRHPPEPAGRR
ncbi:MFS transporter [Streptomyces sp. Caat 7-52]|uniref:MFS transporter n=1 Tax=Streptomyces sp. Caat 7-52 TaxID=2949637 RepID=UPI003334C9DB